MRLTCPNCGAQYEVDGSMIPDDGRDVQCSACGQTWFQLPEGAEIAEAEDPAASSGPLPEREPDSDRESEVEVAFDQPAEEAETDDGADAGAIPDERAADRQDDQAVPADDDNWTEDDADAFDDEMDDDNHRHDAAAEEAEAASAPVAPAEAAPAADPVPPSQRLDDSALSVLREEARREAEARRAEQAQALETQPELGLTEGEDTPDRRSVRAHVARMRGEDSEGEDDALPGSRGDLLPDIEQLNSTLRPASEHAETAEVADPVVVEAQHRRGFRWGFTLMIVLAALLAIGYVFSPQIAQQAPALEPAVVGYVDSVNAVRDGLEGLLTRTTESISNATGGDADSE